MWDRVQSLLTTPALALDIPSRVQSVTPDGCAAAAVSELDLRGVGSVVLVLHSLSGVLAPGLAQRLDPRLKGCVFVSGVIPPPGGSFLDAFGFVSRLVLRVLFRFTPRGLEPSAEMIRAELCNDLSDQDAEQLTARYAAEWPGLYLTPAGTMPDHISTVYVRLSRDRNVTSKQQALIIARLRSPRIHTTNAGHMAMLSSPAELAKVLDAEAQNAAPGTSPGDG